MNQNIWGAHLWFSLHTITFTYPLTPSLEDKQQFKNFFISLQNVVPCSICQKNYKRHLKESPLDNHLNNRKDLVYWLIDVHNMVNSEIGKKIMSYETVIKKYENVYNKNLLSGITLENNNTNTIKEKTYNFQYIFLLFLIIIFIIFIIKISKIY